MNTKMLSFDINSLGVHHLEFLVWLSHKPDILENNAFKPLIVSGVYGLFEYRENIVLKENEREALLKLQKVDIFMTQMLIQMILTGCSERDAFNWAGARK